MEEVERLSEEEMSKLVKNALMEHIRELYTAFDEDGRLVETTVVASPEATEAPFGSLHVVMFDNAHIELANAEDVAGFLQNNKLVKSAETR